MLGQLENRTKQKELEEWKRKEEGIKERHRLELAVKLAQEAEEKKHLEKRSKLKNLKEEDLHAKQEFRAEHGGQQPTQQADNLMSKVFVREPHESFARRAKNDLVVGYITEKFLSKVSPKQAISTNIEEIVKKKNEEQELQQQERLHKRKEKEREQKLILDLQVQKLAKDKEAVKKQSMELGARISHDVETYEQEQKRKKLEQIQKYQKH